MKLLNSLLLFAVFSFWFSFPARAYTHITPPLQPELIASGRSSFQTAKIWFLPDYQQYFNNRTETGNGGGDLDKANPCSSYGADWVASYDSSLMTCKAHRITPSLTCYADCRCKNPVSLGPGERCTLWCQDTTCIAKTCKTAVALNPGEQCAQYCASDYSICTAKDCAAEVTIDSGEECQTYCNDQCVVKRCKPAVSLASNQQCLEHCASDNSICTAAADCPTGTVVKNNQCLQDTCPQDYTKNACKSDQVQTDTQTTEAGSTCYACRAKDDTCPNGYDSAACNSSQVQTDTTVTEAGTTCYACRAKDDTCAGGYSKSACSSNQVQTGTSVTEAGSTCYACRAKDNNCPSGYFSSSCSSNQVQTGTKTTEAGTICYACRAKDDTCASGYSKSACSSNQVQTGTKTTEAGTICYACRAKDDTCASGYSKSACSSNQVQTGTKTTEAGTTCYACRAKTCADITCPVDYACDSSTLTCQEQKCKTLAYFQKINPKVSALVHTFEELKTNYEGSTGDKIIIINDQITFPNDDWIGSYNNNQQDSKLTVAGPGFIDPSCPGHDGSGNALITVPQGPSNREILIRGEVGQLTLTNLDLNITSQYDWFNSGLIEGDNLILSNINADFSFPRGQRITAFKGSSKITLSGYINLAKDGKMLSYGFETPELEIMERSQVDFDLFSNPFFAENVTIGAQSVIGYKPERLTRFDSGYTPALFNFPYRGNATLGAGTMFVINDNLSEKDTLFSYFVYDVSSLTLNAESMCFYRPTGPQAEVVSECSFSQKPENPVPAQAMDIYDAFRCNYTSTHINSDATNCNEAGNGITFFPGSGTGTY